VVGILGYSEITSNLLSVWSLIAVDGWCRTTDEVDLSEIICAWTDLIHWHQHAEAPGAKASAVIWLQPNSGWGSNILDAVYEEKIWGWMFCPPHQYSDQIDAADLFCAERLLGYSWVCKQDLFSSVLHGDWKISKCCKFLLPDATYVLWSNM